MRVALLYPPPWKIVRPGDPSVPAGQGVPREYQEGDLDADFFQVPYGLLTLASEAIDAGHQVKVINLASFSWVEVKEVIARLEADVYGMSCWTANRRGVSYVAQEIRDQHPGAKIIVGGPHATPFATEILDHFPAIDLVTRGESEATFLEILRRIEEGRDLSGIEGSAYRENGKGTLSPARASLRKLDDLTPPQHYFATHIMMTSRGCPWQCTFCGAETTWGRGFRGHSVPFVVDAIEKALEKLPVRMIQIKDDTFTANKKRALQICEEIRRRKLQFLWSCDTRVDVLDEELVLEMRRAGCQRLSLGVESGSDQVLENIDKKITSDEIIAAANMAKAVGIQVRFFMMLGNRGETVETFHETLEFLDRALPHQYVFSCLSVYPGTRDFQAAVEAGWLSSDVFFREDFQEFKTPFDADEKTTRVLNDWFHQHRGVQQHYLEDVATARAILDQVGEYHAAHLDLAGAHFREGQLDDAERHVRRALDLGYPVPGLAYNYLAVIEFLRGNVKGMQEHFMTAAKTDPQHNVLIQNVERVRAWFKERGPERGLVLRLEARHDFQLLERTLQPTLPGPLPEDFDDWSATPRPIPRHLPGSHEVTPERYGKQGFPERRLKVLV